MKLLTKMPESGSFRKKLPDPGTLIYPVKDDGDSRSFAGFALN